MARRLLVLLVLAAAGVSAPAGAHDRPGLYLDPQLLPPDTRQGECVTRRITGPAGAYRWERIECEGASAGWSDFDRWGYGRPPLDVAEGPSRGDRYGSRNDDAAYGRGYDGQGWGGYGEPVPAYRVAGRDAWGYLVWPGKLP